MDYGGLPIVVHPAGHLLASGTVGAGALPARLAGIVAVPDRGSCCPRSSRSSSRDFVLACPRSSRPPRDLSRSKPYRTLVTQQ